MRETDFMWMRGTSGLMLVRQGKSQWEKWLLCYWRKMRAKKEAMKGDQRVQDGTGATFRGEDDGMTGELI